MFFLFNILNCFLFPIDTACAFHYALSLKAVSSLRWVFSRKKKREEKEN